MAHGECTLLCFHSWAHGLADENGACNAWSVSTNASLNATLAELVFLRVTVEIIWVGTHLCHINLLHGFVFRIIWFHLGRSIVQWINSTLSVEILVLRMNERILTRLASTFIVRVRTSYLNDLRILQRMLLAAIFWYETLMFRHVRIVSSNHILSGIWAPPDRTNISLLNMIIRIEIWIDLNVVVIAAGQGRLKLIEYFCVASMHITVEWALRGICQFWWVICMGCQLNLLVNLISFTA